MKIFSDKQTHARVSTTLPVILLFLLIISTTESIAASETRTNISLNFTPFHIGSAGYGVFIKNEERFRRGQLVYAKQIYGITVKMKRLFSFMPFYAHKHLHYSEAATKELSGLDINLGLKSSGLFLKNRVRGEYHITDDFYRIRNAIEAGYTPVPPVLSLFSRYEFRFDTDQERINLNDMSGGLIIKPAAQLPIRLYYNREMKRRNRNSWDNTDSICFSVSVVL